MSARPPRHRARPEALIHAAVCDHLRLRAHPEVLFLHPANGGSRDIREAAHLKRFGVLPGASDLLLFRPGALLRCTEVRQLDHRDGVRGRADDGSAIAKLEGA